MHNNRKDILTRIKAILEEEWGSVNEGEMVIAVHGPDGDWGARFVQLHCLCC